MRRTSWSFVVVVTLELAAAASQAHADRAPGAVDELGERGQYILTTDSRLDWQRSSYPYVDDEGMEAVAIHHRVNLRLAIDKVIRPRVTFGVHGGFDADDYGGTAIKGFFAGARVGALIGLGDDEDISLWPRVGLTYGNVTYQFTRSQYTAQVVRITASAPIVWRPVARFFLGAGPTFEHEVFAQAGQDAPLPKVTILGVQGILGCWFHGY